MGALRYGVSRIVRRIAIGIFAPDSERRVGRKTLVAGIQNFRIYVAAAEIYPQYSDVTGIALAAVPAGMFLRGEASG